MVLVGGLVDTSHSPSVELTAIAREVKRTRRYLSHDVQDIFEERYTVEPIKLQLLILVEHKRHSGCLSLFLPTREDIVQSQRRPPVTILFAGDFDVSLVRLSTHTLLIY